MVEPPDGDAENMAGLDQTFPETAVPEDVMLPWPLTHLWSTSRRMRTWFVQRWPPVNNGSAASTAASPPKNMNTSSECSAGVAPVYHSAGSSHPTQTTVSLRRDPAAPARTQDPALASQVRFIPKHASACVARASMPSYSFSWWPTTTTPRCWLPYLLKLYGRHFPKVGGSDWISGSEAQRAAKVK